MSDGEGLTAQVKNPARLGFERTALLVSAAAAVIAVGAAVRRDLAPPPPPPPAAAGPAGAAATTASKEVATAIAQLEAHLEKNPDDAKGWRMLGWAYGQTQRSADAIAAYRRATTLDPGNAEGWSALGEVLALTGPGDRMPADAETAFRKALSIDAKDPRARYFMAVATDLSGNHEGAIDAFVALLKDTPADAPWEDNVRQAIDRVARQNGIDIAGRVPAPRQPDAAAPGMDDKAAAVAALPPEQREAMIRGMVDSLAARLATQPGDVEGWLRLIQARLVLGEPEAATKAYRDATAALANDKASCARIEAEARSMGVPGI